MFGWSSNNNTNSSSSNRYPGARGSSGNAAQRHGNNSTNTGGGTLATSMTSQSGISSRSITRQEQWNTYINHPSLKNSIRPVGDDLSTSDTFFKTTSGLTLCLRVHLPPRVIGPPHVSLYGVIAHHDWLDTRMKVIGYYPLQSNESVWQQSGWSLTMGDVVLHVIDHFQRNPPTIIEFTDPILRREQTGTNWQQQQSHPINNNKSTVRRTTSSFSSKTSTVGTTSPNGRRSVTSKGSTSLPPPDYQTLLDKIPMVEMPPIPHHFEQLDEMDRDALEVLQADELELHAFCHRLDISESLRTMASSVISENALLAQKNLQQQTKLNETHEQVCQLQKQLRDKLEKYQTLEKQKQTLVTSPDINVVRKELNRLKKQIADESDHFANTWMEQSVVSSLPLSSSQQQQQPIMSVEEFNRQYIEKRKLYHRRAAKLELLQR